MMAVRFVIALLCLGLVSGAMAQPEIADSQIDGYTVVLKGIGFGDQAPPQRSGTPVLDDQSVPVAEAAPDAPAKNESTHPMVVMGDNSIFDECQQRIELDVKAWSDTEITVEIEPGDQLPGTMMYLFVVDKDGQANLAGRSFAIPEADRPGQPGQPTVQ